jgi:RNA polymerase sigma-70 factor (sigma-E family)
MVMLHRTSGLWVHSVLGSSLGEAEMQTPRSARRAARAALDGKPEAVRLSGPFEYFYLQEYPTVVALAYALSGSRAGAEDIAQEAFLRAYRDWDRVGSYEHQAAWVRRVAANLATSGLRRRLVEAQALTRLAGRWEPTVDPLPAESAEFWAAVRALPRRQAQAVALYYFQDLSVQETATVLGCSEGTVKAHLAKARRALARQLQPAPPEDR